jgi:hypothetical protein
MSDPQNSEGNKQTSAKTVTVGCKLPNGLILEMGKFGDEDYKAVVLKGANSAVVHGGYGMTEGVDESFWAAWKKKHARLSFVQKGLVFAVGDIASARDHAIDLSAVKTGLEPLDPLKKIVGPTGETLVEVDASHFAQAKRDVAQSTQRRG